MAGHAPVYPGLGEAEFMATLASACLDTDLKRRGRESIMQWVGL
jgi:hypothetical protein